MVNKFFLIETVTNLHVGSGDMNFNIIDNEVQRDVVTKFPTIHASSLKGALREFFEYKHEDNLVKEVFGDPNTAGSYRFFSGNLLVLPARSNKRQFFRATCKKVLNGFLNLCSALNYQTPLNGAITEFIGIEAEKGSPVIFEDLAHVKIEDHYAVYKPFTRLAEVEKLLGSNVAMLNDDDFAKLSEGLPVIARNCLENGISQNLWYEEVVPRESRFYFAVLESDSYKEEFEKMITENVIQIGANASIGYGFTKIYDIKKLAGDKNE